MLKFWISLFIILLFSLLPARAQITKVNFSRDLGLNYNAAGPLLTAVDEVHNRIAVLNANASMVSVIDGRGHRVVNIPVAGRGIQHFKDEALTIDPATGVIYAIGKNCFHVVFPKQETSKTYQTKSQFEMIAVDSRNGNAFLVGRSSKNLAFFNYKKESISYIPWVDREEKLVNLNQTPSPPIRKVVCDTQLNQIIAVDGFTSTLTVFDASSGKIMTSRSMDLVNGVRWHYAGYNEDTHHLYLVVENDKRQVVQAAKIEVQNGRDIIVELPKFTEGVGITYNPKLDEIYIPYDNHPTVHVVDFKNGGELHEIKVPLYGNDASAIDQLKDILYIACWAYGEIEVIDLKTRKFLRRIPNLGILPHTFNMSFNPVSRKLYIPIGATAVNGVFGSAVTAIDPEANKVEKIYTGWAPVDLIQLPGKDEFLVFGAENRFARVNNDGSYTIHKLPFDYPHQAVYTKAGNVYLSYGPHQSYWPNVYIWGAKNGLLHIDSKTLEIMDRRMPRLAHEITLGDDGTLYALQNSWGKEKQFISVFKDEIREWEPRERIELETEINRENIQRLLKFDSDAGCLYLVKIGETDADNGLLQIIDSKEKKQIASVALSLNPTDLIFDEHFIYVANFNSNSVTKVDKSNYTAEEIRTGSLPLKMAKINDQVYVINHGDNTLQIVGRKTKPIKIKASGRVDNIKAISGQLYLSVHGQELFTLLRFDPDNNAFTKIIEEKYPFGETGFDNTNSAFYLSGQFGDVIYEISRIKSDTSGNLWVSDFLSGNLYIVKID